MIIWHTMCFYGSSQFPRRTRLLQVCSITHRLYYYISLITFFFYLLWRQTFWGSFLWFIFHAGLWKPLKIYFKTHFRPHALLGNVTEVRGQTPPKRLSFTRIIFYIATWVFFIYHYYYYHYWLRAKNLLVLRRCARVQYFFFHSFSTNVSRFNGKSYMTFVAFRSFFNSFYKHYEKTVR